MAQPSVSKLYNSVIDEVIESVREAVLDEGLDEQVLVELKSLWLEKLTASKALDTTPTPSHIPVPANTSSPARRAVPVSSNAQLVAAVHPAATSGHQPVQQLVATTAYRPQMQQAQPIDMSGAAATATMALPQVYQQQLIAGGIQLQQTSNGLAAVIPASALPSALPSGSLTIQPAQMTTMLQAPTMQLQPQNLSTKPNATNTVPHQVDGAADAEENDDQLTSSAAALPQSCRPRTTRRGRRGRKSRQIEVVIQVDGADSSSDDDDDVDDDDDDDNDNDIENNDELEEEPLNSDDDVTDDEKQDQFETDNVIVCQYDKITRCKNKWRFNLKDGIMNLNQRDHVFQKAHGEAEW